MTTKHSVLVKNDNFYSENTDVNVCAKSHEMHKVTKCQCQSHWNYTTISPFIWHSLRSTGLSTVRTRVSYANTVIGTRRGMWEINYGLCYFGIWAFFWHSSITPRLSECGYHYALDWQSSGDTFTLEVARWLYGYFSLGVYYYYYYYYAAFNAQYVGHKMTNHRRKRSRKSTGSS